MDIIWNTSLESDSLRNGARGGMEMTVWHMVNRVIRTNIFYSILLSNDYQINSQGRVR